MEQRRRFFEAIYRLQVLEASHRKVMALGRETGESILPTGIGRRLKSFQGVDYSQKFNVKLDKELLARQLPQLAEMCLSQGETTLQLHCRALRTVFGVRGFLQKPALPAELILELVYLR